MEKPRATTSFSLEKHDPAVPQVSSLFITFEHDFFSRTIPKEEVKKVDGEMVNILNLSVYD